MITEMPWTKEHMKEVLSRLDTTCTGCRFGPPLGPPMEGVAGGPPCRGCHTKLVVGVVRNFKNGLNVTLQCNNHMIEFILNGMTYNTLTNLQVIEICREYQLTK